MHSQKLMLTAGIALIIAGYLSPLADLPATRQVLWGSMAIMGLVFAAAYRRERRWYPC